MASAFATTQRGTDHVPAPYQNPTNRVVLVFVTGNDAEDPHADHFEESVFDAGRITWVVQSGGEVLGKPDALVELPHGQQTGVGGKRGVGDLDLDWQGFVEIEIEERSSV